MCGLQSYHEVLTLLVKKPVKKKNVVMLVKDMGTLKKKKACYLLMELTCLGHN